MDCSSAGIEGAAAADDDSAWIHPSIRELVVSPQVSRPLRRDGSSPHGCRAQGTRKGLLTSAKTISQVRFGGFRFSGGFVPDVLRRQQTPDAERAVVRLEHRFDGSAWALDDVEEAAARRLAPV